MEIELSLKYLDDTSLESRSNIKTNLMDYHLTLTTGFIASPLLTKKVNLRFTPCPASN